MIISCYSILTGGILTCGMIVFHLFFPKVFRWDGDLPKVSSLNRRVIFTIHLALLLTFLIFAWLSFIYTEELAACVGLAFGITLSIALFWLWRAIWQVVYFSPFFKGRSRVMKRVHILVGIFFMALSAAYSIPVVQRILK